MQTAQTVLLVIHVMVAASLVGLVLMQKSEGGAIGIGGGGFMTGRGAANALTRLTAYLATGFFATSIALALLSNHINVERSVFETPPAVAAPAVPGTAPAPVVPTTTPAVPGTAPVAAETPAAPALRGGVLDKLQVPGGAQAPLPRAPQGP